MEHKSINIMLDEMIISVSYWLRSKDYNYIECNYVPPSLFFNNHKINTLLRTIFRLCPFNFRIGGKNVDGYYPYTPQCNVAMLKAYNIIGDRNICSKLFSRTIGIKSPKTTNFSLKQGIQISINLYENSSEDPTPLNTAWFGEYILNERLNVISEKQKKELLYSISNYLINELGYIDFNNNGIYFYYGPTLKKIVYNASAIISSFLLDVADRYNDPELKKLGERGVKYIVNQQNEDGSWFYAAAPERKTIDCFHQSYILQSLLRSQKHISFDISECIKRADNYYRSLFTTNGDITIPIRYDKRYKPKNTWLFQKYDGRDISEALIYFSVYNYDANIIKGLVKLLYNQLYNKKHNYISPELFVYGKNHIPYIEFQGWYLYAMITLKHYLDENHITIS